MSALPNAVGFKAQTGVLPHYQAAPGIPAPQTIERSELQSTSATSSYVVGPVSLSTSELIGLRNARAMFDELRSLLTDAVLPAIGGARHPVSVRLTTLLGEVHLHSAGFLAQHWREADRFVEAKEVANVDHRNH